MPVVTDTPRTTAPDRPTSKPDRHAAALEAARAAGRLAGERLNRTSLDPRQRATVAAVMGDGPY
ncbi:hypothetical protein FM113_07465 [Leucobacter sp. 7(1)]|uniref:hypothetical protein n=1 Tax=Leucobacter sp. 7(1) TaxID=1255613 RepID=UPI00097EE9C1|nr:hypothetical protein [Leucobacter sp. 7(1)]SJN09867.1 hypothetical protein FM113_07465 [Leucobacter sp. 7(1)]